MPMLAPRCPVIILMIMAGTQMSIGPTPGIIDNMVIIVPPKNRGTHPADGKCKTSQSSLDDSNKYDTLEDCPAHRPEFLKDPVLIFFRQRAQIFYFCQQFRPSMRKKLQSV